MINKKELKELVEQKLGQREISLKVGCSQSTIKLYLKKYGLKTINTRKYEDIKVNIDEKYCPKCKKIKNKCDFYKVNTRSDALQSKCKICNHNNVKARAKGIKLKMLEYKGNQCIDCSLHIKNTKACVFDFHHLDPSTKDINFNIIRWKSWDVIKKELDKCVILCSNCHRIRHSNELF
jgi:hypothetical protein